MTRKIALILTAAVASLALVTSAMAKKGDGDSIFVAGAELYTLTNLHPDMANRRLYSTNYQLPALMKRCTKITIDKISKKKMLFTTEKGEQYTYLWQKYAMEPLDEHLKMYFGESCSDSAVTRLSKKDQEGIKKGKPLVGMTKEGVILALGPPSKHVVPDTDEYDSWRYWKNKWTTFIVEFENGKVTSLQGI